jgi:hypothetical protein
VFKLKVFQKYRYKEFFIGSVETVKIVGTVIIARAVGCVGIFLDAHKNEVVWVSESIFSIKGSNCNRLMPNEELSGE